MPLDASPASRLDEADSGPFLDRNARPCCGNWAVAYTHSQAERWARDNLTRQGFVTFLPLVLVRRRDRVLRSMWHTVEVPLFPRYLFIQHHSPQFWRPIRETPGIAAVLHNGHTLQYVQQGAVEALQAVQQLPAPPTPWEPGTPCALLSGPLAGHDAVVLSVSRDTAHLAVLLFGALRHLTAPLTALIPRD